MMNPSIKHQVASRQYTTFRALQEEQQLDASCNYLYDLSYLTIIDCIGEKSIEFLQGQLTADLHKVNDIQMLQAAQCNLKGRILSLLDVLQWKGIKLVVPADLALLTQSSLEKTALLSRVKLQPNRALKVYGYFHQNSNDIVPFNAQFFSDQLYALTYGQDYCYYHLGHGYYIFVVDSKVSDTLEQPFASKKQFLGSLSWHTSRLLNNQIEIYPESRGLFLPHRLNLHKTPLLSFDKGCYKGQEIIARTHYRATIKHALRYYKIISSEDLKIGMKLINLADNTEFGELVDYSILDKNHYLVCLSHLNTLPDQIGLEGSNIPIELVVLG